MSFGYGVGDFLATLKLANKIRREFVGAPTQFKDISNEVRSLSIVLQDIEVVSSESELDKQQKIDLEQIASSCEDVLKDLDKAIDRYRELGSSDRNLGKKLKRVWKRLQWEPDDIRELRDRIISNITLLNAYLGRVSSRATFVTKTAVERLNQQQDDQERLDIFNWLTTVDYTPEQNDFINRRQAGTGQWLLDSFQFQDWLTKSGETLFCPGFPGVGKTILTSTVINYLSSKFRKRDVQGDGSENASNVGIAYIYCNFRRQYEQKAENLLASLLKQLSQGRDTIPDSVKTLHDKHKGKQTRPSIGEISKSFQSVATLYSRVFIVVDALDECQARDSRERFLRELFHLQARFGANVFVTSRFIPNIVKIFCNSVSLEIRASKKDVESYLEGHIGKLSSFEEWSLPLQREIQTGISDVVDGMFLLAQIYLNFFDDKTTTKAVRRALSHLQRQSPGSGEDQKRKVLDNAYHDAMDRINEQKPRFREIATQVLLWITCAKRPLTALELQHALAVEDGDSELDEDALERTDRMVSVCIGLVTVDEESGIIRLVHYTTQEYFEQAQNNWFPNAQSEIATTCLTYLSFSTFESGFCESDQEFKQRLERYPLYYYAAKHWGDHAHEALTVSQVVAFLKGKRRVEASVQTLLATKRYWENSYYTQKFAGDFSGLHLTAYFGIIAATSAILELGNSPDLKDSDGKTPLSWAASRGHEAVVKLLLETGQVEVDSKDKYGYTPLWLARERGHVAIVKLLLETGQVEVDSKDKYSYTLLSWAVERGHVAIVKLLLETGQVEVDSKDKYSRTPLWLATEKGHVAIVKLLLETGQVKVDSKDDYGQTLLSWAARKGHEAIVKLLLETGQVEIDSKDDYGQTPLSWAAESGHEAIVKLLLETGQVEVDSKDYYGQTPLLWAARGRHKAIVKLLLETGQVEVDSKDYNGQTPLSLAIEKGDEAIEKGDEAIEKGDEAIVKLLLETGQVKVDSKDDYGYTPLSWATMNGHQAIVKLLLEIGQVKVESKDKYGQTAL